MVRMLCSRSASLIRITRMSLTIASSIFRKLSACTSALVRVGRLVSLLSPSTTWASSSPKAAASSPRPTSVSSRTSWRSAPMTLT